MPYRFRMILGGLCAFVPEPGLGTVRALMVNTDPQAAHGRVGSLGHVPEIHTPTLIYNRANEVGANPATGSRQAVWPLNEEEITVTTQQPAPLTVVGTLAGGKSGSPTLGDRELDWVPNLVDVLPLAGKIETDCLDIHPKKEFLKARIRIDQGTLRVDEFASFQANEVLTEFVPLPPAAKVTRQALPHRVAWEIDVPDGQSVTIHSRPFSKTMSSPILNFQPAVGEAEVQVLLVNLCCGDYLTAKPPKRLDPDDDFECFYMLLDNFNTLIQQIKPLPVPVAVQYTPAVATGNSAGTAGGIKCTMARAGAQ